MIIFKGLIEVIMVKKSGKWFYYTHLNGVRTLHHAQVKL